MNILIINGPNINFIGKREPEIYGHKTYNDLVNYILNYAKNHNHNIKIYQSNHEGEVIDIIQDNYQGFEALIINPGAYTHYSYAIYDCLKSINIRKIEVHMSDIYNREDFRKISVTKAACETQIYGNSFESYIDAINYLQERS